MRAESIKSKVLETSKRSQLINYKGAHGSLELNIIDID